MVKIALAMLFVCSGVACTQSVSCTEIGCGDHATIHLRRTDGMTPALATELEIDGRRVTCSAPMPNGATIQVCDDTRVHVVHRELTDCTETKSPSSLQLSCVPNGRFEQTIGVDGVPKKIVVKILENGTVTTQKSFEPNYTTVRPNGDGCEPTCKQYDETWEIP